MPPTSRPSSAIWKKDACCLTGRFQPTGPHLGWIARCTVCKQVHWIPRPANIGKLSRALSLHRIVNATREAGLQPAAVQLQMSINHFFTLTFMSSDQSVIIYATHQETRLYAAAGSQP